MEEVKQSEHIDESSRQHDDDEALIQKLTKIKEPKSKEKFKKVRVASS